MRFISVPPNLTPMYLLEFWEAPELDLFRTQALEKIARAVYEDALALLEPQLSYALMSHKHHQSALLLLYKADLRYRMHYWGEALTHIQAAQQKLHSVVGRIARYNRAIAYYWEGLLQYSIRAEGQAIRAFNTAMELLLESQDYWQFHQNAQRVQDCHNLMAWIGEPPPTGSLLFPHVLQQTVAASYDALRGGIMALLPLYERAMNIPHTNYRRKEVIALPTIAFSIPWNMAASLVPGYIPHQTLDLNFLSFSPSTHYLAVTISENGELLSTSQVGDILLLEVSLLPTTVQNIKLTQDLHFIRHYAGDISFRPYNQLSTDEVMAIPRLSIRQESEYEL